MSEEDLFTGLQALADAAFPRKCANCGNVYHSTDEFIGQTERISGRSGLKESEDDDGKPIVELYRNCKCGSTMLEFFGERRDTSETGLRRREKFGKLMDRLESHGVPTDVAREELLKMMRGRHSELINGLLQKESEAKLRNKGEAK